MIKKCPLCTADAGIFFETPQKRYFRCSACAAVFLDPTSRVSSDDEKKRYELHRNDPSNHGYLAFLAPLIREIEERFDVRHEGLDFGSGPEPVLADILRAKGYSVALYDPYFSPDQTTLARTYDFIVCCEVIEHFCDPAKEFALMRGLLKPGGALICMTDPYVETLNFKNWYYKNDATHVFFYHEKTFELIKERFGFSSLEVKGRVAVFF